MDIFLMITYIFSAVLGSTLIKYGSQVGIKALFIVPIVNMSISLISILGIIAYGTSFIAYVILLTRFDLSFISPLLVAFVYILLMLTALIVFKETFTPYKTIGCGLILVGIILILTKR
jgi:drug/metabolite transporter (DMT)-like permease